MTRTFMISLPDTPNVYSLPLMMRLYTIAEKQSGHQVTAIFRPPTVSLTISWELSIGTE